MWEFFVLNLCSIHSHTSNNSALPFGKETAIHLITAHDEQFVNKAHGVNETEKVPFALPVPCSALESCSL